MYLDSISHESTQIWKHSHSVINCAECKRFLFIHSYTHTITRQFGIGHRGPIWLSFIHTSALLLPSVSTEGAVLYSIWVRMMNDFILLATRGTNEFYNNNNNKKKKRMKRVKCARRRRHPKPNHSGGWETIWNGRVSELWSGVTYVRWTGSVCMNNATYYIHIIIRLVTIAPLLTI